MVMTSAKAPLVNELAARQTAAALRTNIFAPGAKMIYLTRFSSLGGYRVLLMFAINLVPVNDQYDTSVEL